MAYTLFSEIAEGRTANVDQKYNRTYTRVFLVRTSDATYGPGYAGSHPSLPTIWSAHPEDVKAYCLSLQPSQDQGDPTLWRITVNYGYNLDAPSAASAPSGDPAVETQQTGQPPADRVENPLSRPRDYSVATVSYPIGVTYDRSNNLIKNSADDPFLPPTEIVKGGATITVGLNSVNSPSAAWIGAIGGINASTYTIGPYVIGTALAKLNSVSANLVYENNVSYWRWSLVFEYRPNGWAYVVNDMGMFKKSGGTRKPIDINGVNVTVPVNLDGSGGVLAVGGTPVALTFHVYPRYTFPAL